MMPLIYSEAMRPPGQQDESSPSEPAGESPGRSVEDPQKKEQAEESSSTEEPQAEESQQSTEKQEKQDVSSPQDGNGGQN